MTTNCDLTSEASEVHCLEMCFLNSVTTKHTACSDGVGGEFKTSLKIASCSKVYWLHVAWKHLLLLLSRESLGTFDLETVLQKNICLHTNKLFNTQQKIAVTALLSFVWYDHYQWTTKSACILFVVCFYIVTQAASKMQE